MVLQGRGGLCPLLAHTDLSRAPCLPRAALSGAPAHRVLLALSLEHGPHSHTPSDPVWRTVYLRGLYVLSSLLLWLSTLAARFNRPGNL